MSGIELVESRKNEIAVLCRRYGVVNLRLFGSALTDQWNSESSDLDFLAEYGPESEKLRPLDRLVGLQARFEELFGRKVDVIDLGATKNLTFRRKALSESSVLYAE